VLRTQIQGEEQQEKTGTSDPEPHIATPLSSEYRPKSFR